MHFFLRQVCVVHVRDVDGAVLGAGAAPRALLLIHVPGLLDEADLEAPRLPFYRLDAGVGHDRDIRVRRAFDEFRGKDAHGAVVGGEGLVELGTSFPRWQGLLSTRYTLNPEAAASRAACMPPTPAPTTMTAPIFRSAETFRHHAHITSSTISEISLTSSTSSLAHGEDAVLEVQDAVRAGRGNDLGARGSRLVPPGCRKIAHPSLSPSISSRPRRRSRGCSPGISPRP